MRCGDIVSFSDPDTFNCPEYQDIIGIVFGQTQVARLPDANLTIVNSLDILMELNGFFQCWHCHLTQYKVQKL